MAVYVESKIKKAKEQAVGVFESHRDKAQEGGSWAHQAHTKPSKLVQPMNLQLTPAWQNIAQKKTKEGHLVPGWSWDNQMCKEV